jgi:hypothetical protein
MGEEMEQRIVCQQVDPEREEEQEQEQEEAGVFNDSLMLLRLGMRKIRNEHKF